MAITRQDRMNMRLGFVGYWKGRDQETVIRAAHSHYRRNFPASTVDRVEFRQLLDLFGHKPVAVGGGVDRLHDVRLTIGSGG